VDDILKRGAQRRGRGKDGLSRSMALKGGKRLRRSYEKSAVKATMPSGTKGWFISVESKHRSGRTTFDEKVGRQGGVSGGKQAGTVATSLRNYNIGRSRPGGERSGTLTKRGIKL